MSNEENDAYYFVEKSLPVPPAYSAGWVAPDGKFYACGHTEHDYIAETIVHFRSHPSIVGVETNILFTAVRVLEQARWVRVETNGVVFTCYHRMDDFEPNEAQAATLVDIALAADAQGTPHAGRFAQNIMSCLNKDIPDVLESPGWCE